MDATKATVTQASHPSSASKHDVERTAGSSRRLLNSTITSYTWTDLSVTVRDRATKSARPILISNSGTLRSGSMLALMGPSGSGKTTLLNALAFRQESSSGKTITGSRLINGRTPSLNKFRDMAAYVEQDDALMGSLTVTETIDFAARLSLEKFASVAERKQHVRELVQAFGLADAGSTLIGTSLRSGVSGGQKRRVSVAAQLVTAPKLLLLDEPTSGLDAFASREVMAYIRQVAKEYNLLVIASIHQPGTSTFNLFDSLMLLSGGKTCYFGLLSEIKSHFTRLDLNMPDHINPSEWLLDLVNTDFAHGETDLRVRVTQIQDGWASSPEASTLAGAVNNHEVEKGSVEQSSQRQRPRFLSVLLALLHRSFIKSYRDVVVYGIRYLMYAGLAILLGTVFLRLKAEQAAIQPLSNALFFSGAFMSFMAVSYTPSFLEDRALFIKERSNGLYSALEFTLANFLIGLPYLFGISLLFSVIAYWLVNFRPTADGFFTFVCWLYLDLLAAEALVVLVAALLPVFVVALAVVAFANGLWMAVNGFLISPRLLNVFWRYVFSYIDYQGYVFRGMAINEFGSRNYTCDSSCHCLYQSDLAAQCKIRGSAVLEQVYGFKNGGTGKWVGIMLGIVVGYRVLGLAALHFKKV
ncbi:MAG: hypothetical protein M1814_004516 [Vezdaea aestivalis]|nr:MAG: hypothetical protein M1814_004516 [Vezdaea aestivalis]